MNKENSCSKTLILFFLVFFLTLGGHAQIVRPVDTLFPRVHRIALNGVDTNATFISKGSDLLYLLVFLSPDCPLSKNYTVVLNQLWRQYNHYVVFSGIVPGKTYTEDVVKNYGEAYGILFPLWIDSTKKLSNYLHATTTPEVVLLNKSGALVYRGAIDDWAQALGKKKAKPEQNYLSDAIAQYLDFKPIHTKQTKPIGCLINEF